MIITPKTKLSQIPKITPKYLSLLNKLGLLTVADFLRYFPFRYDDFSQISQISQDNLDKIITVEGVIKKIKVARLWRRKLTIAEALLEDQNQTPFKATWFNQPYLGETLPEGTCIRLSGKLTLRKKHFTFVGPAWERSGRDATNTGGIIPVYPETKGLTSKWLRWQMKNFLNYAKDLPDPIPTDIRKKLHLYDLGTALKEIHFPTKKERLLIAQKRFAFEEMFLVQLRAQQVKNDWEKNKAVFIKTEKKIIESFTQRLPFELTKAQKKSSKEILEDLGKNRPMNRLLNGDVGSGKTVVSAIASLDVLSSGYQVALMAPTEVLARQHFETLVKVFKGYDFSIALLTNSYKMIYKCHSEAAEGGSKNLIRSLDYARDDKNIQNDKRESLLQKISSGKINLVIGTHAIIQKDVKFKNLALIIIDEQHRFGVAQRAYLQKETMNLGDGLANTTPHLLSMTATPIPRTLAIALGGNLDISILDEMPKNRKPIITQVVSPEEREKVYEFLQKEISAGRQIFIIFPLVEESKVLQDVKAAVAEQKKLMEIFPDFKIGLMHGRLKSEEKEKVMRDFKNKELDILVSTSVVEVGVDVPNATVMIIEHADRFGLSQLHQFRGRIGRGEYQSYCFLFCEISNDISQERLRAMEKTTSGFEIAQKDLELRGPGQFFGVAQSGLADVAMENLTNLKLIKISQEEAKNILKQNPTLSQFPALKEALKRFEKDIHLE